MEREWDGRKYQDYEYAIAAVVREIEMRIKADGDIHRGCIRDGDG